MADEKKETRIPDRASDPVKKEAPVTVVPQKVEHEKTRLDVIGIEYSGKTVVFRVVPVIIQNGKKVNIKNYTDRVTCAIE